jgi:proline iminopeptidase
VSAHFFNPQGEYGKFNFLADLSRVTIPTLLLHGELDPIVPVEFAKETFAAFPPGHASIEIYPNCGHDVARDQWDEAAARIRQFIVNGTHVDP